MVYARLDVFFPDGRIESYSLEENNVSVGRAEGNTIVIDTENISRYHFNIVREGDVTSIVDLDSANGTFVDGIQLGVNQPRILQGVEEIIVGQLRIIYQQVDDAPTIPMSPMTDATHRIELPEANCRASLDLDHLAVWPAASSSTELSLTNTGTKMGQFRVEVEGLPEKWVRINRPNLDVEGLATAYVLINIKPPRHPDIQPVHYSAHVVITPEDKPNLALRLPLQIDIRAFTGLGMALSSPRIDAGDTLRLYLHNHGNAPLDLRLRGTDPLNNLQINLRPDRIQLGPGQRLQVQCAVQPRQRALTGGERRQRFDILVKSQDASGFLAVETAQVTVKPMLPSWALVSALGIMLSLVVVAGLALSGVLGGGPQLQLNDVRLNTTQIARGDLLEVAWDVTDAAEIEIWVNGTPQALLNNQAVNRYEVHTTPYRGEVRILVEARQGQDSAAQALSAFVYQPMQVEAFIAQPTQVVRHVVETITIQWNIPGAVLTRLSGLEDFTRAPLRADYGSTQRLEGVAGIAAEPLELVLYAEDEVGNTLEQRLTISAIDPVCTAQASVALREGPSSLYQQISNLPAGEPVVVDAQDAEAGWLRVILVGDVKAWGPRTAFTCAGTFDPDQLRIEIAPPPPTPVATPTLPPPSPTPGT